MKFQKLFLFVISVAAFLSIGCGGGEPANVKPANGNSGNTNVAKANSNNPLMVTTPTPEQTTNNAPTLTPVYKAYCAAMMKKDEAAIRKMYSQDTIKNFEEQMKDSGIKTFGKFLEDDGVTNELCEVRNEQITGETAIAEIRTTGYPNGIKIIFVRENGEWKLTNRDPNFDAKKAAQQPASNTGR
ncbi:MAG: hypothetical protein ABIU09_00370 [Pyrinomonadaceae bacterium]